MAVILGALQTSRGLLRTTRARQGSRQARRDRSGRGAHAARRQVGARAWTRTAWSSSSGQKMSHEHRRGRAGPLGALRAAVSAIDEILFLLRCRPLRRACRSPGASGSARPRASRSRSSRPSRSTADALLGKPGARGARRPLRRARRPRHRRARLGRSRHRSPRRRDATASCSASAFDRAVAPPPLARLPARHRPEAHRARPARGRLPARTRSRSSSSATTHEREYVVQYAETDAAFVRRLCEEEGLYFRFEAERRLRRLRARGRVGARAARPRQRSCRWSTRRGSKRVRPSAFACSAARRRRPGQGHAARLRSRASPSLLLEGIAAAGSDVEQSGEVYRRAGPLHDAGGGRRGGRKTLVESLRAEAKTMRFETSAVGLAPGLVVELERGADYAGTARPEGKLFVVEVEHAWSVEAPRRTMKVLRDPARRAVPASRASRRGLGSTACNRRSSPARRGRRSTPTPRGA